MSAFWTREEAVLTTQKRKFALALMSGKNKT
ncbi:terminase small subunit, partial [Escherichia coli]